jgi:hypothetical protein
MVGVSSITDVIHKSIRKLDDFFAGAVYPRIAKPLRVKPSLSYIELHLVDHCNMNCKGCGHFSPLADEWFADLEEYSRDMLQLQKLFSTIKTIRLMGGEPLLHPQVESFLYSTRACFPKADIRIVTNGILLHDMANTFWEACRSYSIGIDVTVYPPMEKKENAICRLAAEKGVRIHTEKTGSFHALYNKKGDSDAEANFRKCRSRWNTPMLREGKIYICNVPALISYFNKWFGTDIPSTGFVDIYTANLTGWDVRKKLNKSSRTCCYCTLGWDRTPEFPWSTSKRTIEEWDAAASAAP